METSSFYFKILKWGIYLSLFVPLVIFSQYLSPFHFGKMIVFRIFVELMVVFYVPLMIADKRYRPKWNLILTSVSVFTGLYVFTGIIGVNSFNSFWGSLERMGGAFSFIHFWAYFVILASIIKTEIDWSKVLKISTLVGFLSILFAYGQLWIKGKFFVGWQHGDRVIGTIGNPALFAGYLVFVIYLAIFLLLKNGSPKWQKWFFVVVILSGVPVLTITAVRGAVIAFWGSLFLLALFLLFKSDNKKVKKYLSIAVAIFIILVAIIGFSKNQAWVKDNSVLSRISDISFKTDTIQTRLWSWESAWQGIKERPIFGWGPENFMFLHMKYFDSRHFTGLGSETIWDRAHNMPLEIFSTMGIFGLISYLAIFFFLFRFLYKGYKNEKISKTSFGILSAMIIAYFVQNLFIFDTTANYLMFFIVLGYVGSSSEALAKEDGTIVKAPSVILTAFLLFLSLFLIFGINIKAAKANYACTRGIIAVKNSVQDSFNYYKKALDYNSSAGAYEIRHKFATFTIQVANSQRDNKKNVDANLLHYAIKEVEKNIEKYPMDTTPYLYIGRMYILLINQEPETAGDLAEKFIQKAIDVNKKNPRVWYELGQAQILQQKYQESFNSFKQALDLNPNVGLSSWFVGIGAYYLQNYEESAQYLDQAIARGYSGYQNSITDIMRMVSVYEKVKNYQRVKELYELAVLEEPNNAQIHASLATAYAVTGDYVKAREEALKSAEIDPDFEADAQKFIDSLPK
jgi:O-antigen ligase/tetratricopeptide (TPR) repeat protein